MHEETCYPYARYLFSNQTATADVRKNLEGNLEQILEIETSGGVSSRDLLNRLNVYLLPKDSPATPFSPVRENYAWGKPGESNEAVLQESLSVTLSPYPNEQLFPTHHRFSFKCATPSALFEKSQKISWELENFLSGMISKRCWQTPDCQKEIHFIHHGSLLAKNEAKHVTLGVRGISDVKFTVCRILPQQISHLMTQTSGDFQNPQFHYEGFGPEAIVVVENVERVMEEEPDLSPADATKKAMAQITAPIIAISLVLLSVFVPIAFIPGISGTLFRQFAVTISAAMVISALNALTLSPALCAVFLRHTGPRRGIMGRVLGGIDWVRDRYAGGVRRLVRMAVLSLVAGAGVRRRHLRRIAHHADRVPAGRRSGRVLHLRAIA